MTCDEPCREPEHAISRFFMVAELARARLRLPFAFMKVSVSCSSFPTGGYFRSLSS